METMSNDQQSSIEFIIESLMSRNLYTKELLEEFEKAREMYRDEIEAAAIISSAERSTSEAHKKEVHRQEIIAAYKAAMHTQYLESFTMDPQGHVIHKADDYYNKTYNTI